MEVQRVGGYEFDTEDESQRLEMIKFLEDDDLPTFVRINDDEVIYEENPQASFIGEKYLKGELLGEGSYSKVKEVLDVYTLCRRAVKIVKWRKIRKIPNGISNVIREINILKRLKHPNVVSLVEEFFNPQKEKKYIVLEYCCCNLQAMLDECVAKKFPEWQAHYYFTQLILGLEYLHSKGIIHKDIKPANLLLTVNQVLKITDLGVSEELDQFAENDRITTSQGSPVCASPEIAAGDETFSGYKIDIWSCGVTLYRMCTVSYPFEGDNIYKLYDNIAKAEYTIPDHVSSHLHTLIRGMLEKWTKDRFTIADIKNTHWFRQQKPLISEGVLMPAEEGNPKFSMTTLRNLKALIMTENGEHDGGYEEDEEVVTDHTPCYNASNSADPQHGSADILAAAGPCNLDPVVNHSKKSSSKKPSKHKKCTVS